MNRYTLEVTRPKDPNKPNGKQVEIGYSVEARDEAEAENKVMADFCLTRETVDNAIISIEKQLERMVK